MRPIIYIFSLTIILVCGSGSSYKNLPYKIDPSVKSGIIKNSKPIISKDNNVNVDYYYNKRMGLFYKNDSLIKTESDSNRFYVFQTKYAWEKNSLIIKGVFQEVLGSEGFIIEIKDKRVNAKYTCRQYFPVLYTDTSDLSKNVNNLHLKSELNKLVFSEKLNKVSNDTIYGYIELTSPDFFIYDSNENEIYKSKRVLKSYFKSAREEP